MKNVVEPKRQLNQNWNVLLAKSVYGMKPERISVESVMLSKITMQLQQYEK